MVDADEEQLKELAHKLGGATTFTFDWKIQTKWQEYEHLCKLISAQGEVSILVNAVE